MPKERNLCFQYLVLKRKQHSFHNFIITLIFIRNRLNIHQNKTNNQEDFYLKQIHILLNHYYSYNSYWTTCTTMLLYIIFSYYAKLLFVLKHQLKSMAPQWEYFWISDIDKSIIQCIVWQFKWHISLQKINCQSPEWFSYNIYMMNNNFVL